MTQQTRCRFDNPSKIAQVIYAITVMPVIFFIIFLFIPIIGFLSSLAAHSFVLNAWLKIGLPNAVYASIPFAILVFIITFILNANSMMEK